MSIALVLDLCNDQAREFYFLYIGGMKMKIIVTEKIADKGIELLQNAPGVEVVVYRELSREELLDVIDQYDAMIVRSVTNAVLS